MNTLISFLIMFGFLAQVAGQNIYQDFHLDSQFPNNDFNYIPKNSGYYTGEKWRAVIDSTWGIGLSTEKKLQLFDFFWNKVDKEYPSFHNIDVDWNALRDKYRPEIADGVSRGRFYAIMCVLVSHISDVHLSIFDKGVSTTQLKHGVPLLVINGYQTIINRFWFGEENSHFGASLAPMPDSSLFVYDVVDNHPLGLERGDAILGYDGIPWKKLYKELLAAELPFYGIGRIGTNEFSREYGLLTSAGENWHLCDTIDIVKYDSRDTLHLSTKLLEDQNMSLRTTDQLPIPGVPFPGIDDSHWVSWGIIEENESYYLGGKKIGYIYAWSWLYRLTKPFPITATGDDFRKAIQFFIDNNVDGLIIDQRFNLGGDPREYFKGLSILFNTDQDIFTFYERADPNDHLAMQINHDFDFLLGLETNDYLFDHPIAILTGPFAWSAGDLMPLEMKYHPRSRSFGLSTNGAFGASFGGVDISHISSDWVFRFPVTDMAYKQSPNIYLTHQVFPADGTVWFEQEDAAKGEDTVVKRAIEWIDVVSVEEKEKDYPYEYRLSQNYPNPFNPSTTIEFTLPKSEFTTLKVYNILGKEVLTLVSNKLNQGNHSYQFDGKNLASGIYYYQLVAGDFQEVKKMVLMK